MATLEARRVVNRRRQQQLTLDDALIEQSLDSHLASLEAQGVSAEMFLLRLMYRLTLEKLQRFSHLQQQQFLCWLAEDLLRDET